MLDWNAFGNQISRSGYLLWIVNPLWNVSMIGNQNLQFDVDVDYLSFFGWDGCVSWLEKRQLVMESDIWWTEQLKFDFSSIVTVNNRSSITYEKIKKIPILLTQNWFKN